MSPFWETSMCSIFEPKNINFQKLHFFGKSSYIINFLNDILSKILDMTWNVKYLKIFETFSKLDVWSRRTEFSQNWRSLYCVYRKLCKYYRILWRNCPTFVFFCTIRYVLKFLVFGKVPFRIYFNDSTHWYNFVTS